MVYVINIEPFYNNHSRCYTHIYTLDRYPEIPLASITKRVSPPRLSPFQPVSTSCNKSSCCKFALCDPEYPNELLRPGQEGRLFTYLTAIGYEIDNNITKIITRSSDKKHRVFCAITKRLPNN